MKRFLFWQLIFFRWVAVFGAGFCLLAARGVSAASPEYETSNVLLTIKAGKEIIYQDPFFELLDLDGYQLVPITRLASKLGLTVSYRRGENKFVITDTTSGRSAEVFIKEGVYRFEGELAWPDEPPVLLSGDCFISIRFVEAVSGAKIFWDERYQELTIVTPYLVPSQPLEPGTLPAGEWGLAKKEIEPLEGPAFSLGSIRYEVVVENRRTGFGETELDGLLKIRLDGRAGEWAVSAGTALDFDFYEHELDPKLTLLRAKYHENNELIIIGDSEVDLEKTIGEKEIWGALYMNPDRQLRKQLVAYTDLSGTAEEGDEVELYLNDRLYKKQEVSAKGTYLFTDVPLRLKRVNIIRIVIRKKDGSRIETTHRLTASARLTKVKNNEILVATGLYRRKNLEDWEGLMVGVRDRYGLTEDATLEVESAVDYPMVGPRRGNFIGVDSGVAFRIGEHLICTVDWLLGGDTEEQVKAGVQNSLLYCLENGYFEAIIFYIPGTVAQGVNYSSGRGERVVGVLELKNDYILEAEGFLTESAPDELKWTFHGGNLTLTKKFGKYRQNSLAGGILKEWETRTIEDGLLKTDETEVKTKFSLREAGMSSTAEGVLNSTDYTLNNNPKRNLKTLTVGGDFTKSFSETLLAGFGLLTETTWLDQQYQSFDLEGDAAVKWGAWGNTLVTGTFLYRGDNTPGRAGLKTEELKTGLIFQRFLSDRFNILFRGERVTQRHFFDNEERLFTFTSLGSGLNYYWPNDRGKITWELDYCSPVGPRKTPQWTSGFSIERYLPSDLMLKLELEQLYATLWDEKPELVIRFTLNHAWSFADGQVRPFRYSEEDNTAMITGVVYLDENGNGQFDEWEKRLAGITMLIDGRSATTNEEGEYTFSFVEPGIYRVDFNPRSLPADYTPVTGEQVVRIRENEHFFLDFGVTLNGSISGLVFIDSNGDGVHNEGETVLGMVGVSLDHNTATTFTNADGYFFFENVPLGAHRISISLESLPPGLKPAVAEGIDVLITEEALDVVDLQCALLYEFTE